MDQMECQTGIHVVWLAADVGPSPLQARDRMRALTMSLPYEAVLCDIDGVLRHWPSSDVLELAHGLPAGAFAAIAFAPDRLRRAITGEITDEQWRSAIAVDLAQACGSAIRAQAAVAAWSELLPDVDDEVVALLTRVRRVASVALVSNATTRLETDLERQGLIDLADAVVNTARIGFAKPDPRVYLTAAERLGTPPDRCLFVDDTAANVEAARGVGMTAVHYRRIEDLHEALAPMLDRIDPSPRER
jgi:putative hydrolase of the HAD superfamily